MRTYEDLSYGMMNRYLSDYNRKSGKSHKHSRRKRRESRSEYTETWEQSKDRRNYGIFRYFFGLRLSALIHSLFL